MKITIGCECGNRITLSAEAKKYLRLRDNLETERFRYDESDDDKEFRICCDKCHDWITLGID